MKKEERRLDGWEERKKGWKKERRMEKRSFLFLLVITPPSPKIVTYFRNTIAVTQLESCQI